MIRTFIACCIVLAFAPPASASFDALLHATRTKDFDAVRALLAAGSDPNPQHAWYDGYTPLMFAARYGNPEATRLLLEAGAETERRDHNGERAMEWATRAYYLHRLGDVPGTVGLILEAGSPADSDGDRYGISPLMHVSQYGGGAELLRLLLVAGADPNRTDELNETALHRAAWKDGPAVAMLLEAGANPNVIASSLGRTALHVAAGGGATNNARLLLEAGAETEPQYYRGQTALFIAAGGGAGGVVQALLDAGADADAANDDGITPVLAAIRGHSGASADRRAVAVELLAAQTADLDRAFAAAIDAGFDKAAAILLDRGADIDAIDENERSAFAAAASRGEADWFERMIGSGVDIARHGGEAMGAAAGAGIDAHIERLLERGVGVDARDVVGATALLRATGQGRIEAVRLLLDRGADTRARDQQGRGVMAYIKAARAPYEAAIAIAEGSRAYIDVSEERAALALLVKAQAVVQRLLDA